MIDEKALQEIEHIVGNGNKAEIERGRDGLKIVEVKRKVAYIESKNRNPALDVVTSKIEPQLR